MTKRTIEDRDELYVINNPIDNHLVLDTIKSFVDNNDYVFFDQSSKAFMSCDKSSNQPRHFVTKFRSISQINEVFGYVSNECKKKMSDGFSSIGKLDLLKYTHSIGVPIDEDTLTEAAGSGHINVLEWLDDMYCHYDVGVANSAAFNGHVGILRWLKDKEYPMVSATCTNAVNGNQLEALKFLYESWIDLSDDDELCETSASHGNVEMFNYLWERGCTCSYFAYYDAGINGHIDMIKRLVSLKVPGGDDPFEGAIRGGNLEIIRYLYDSGFEMDERTCLSVPSFEGNNIEVLEYLIEKGCVLDSEFCEEAASCGKLYLLKYAHDRGCQWEEQTYWSAISTGRIDILEYLFEQGCPLGKDTFEFTGRYGKLDTFKWLIENSSCDLDEQYVCRAIIASKTNDSLDKFRLFVESKSIRLSRMMLKILCKDGKLDFVKYIHGSHLKMDSSSIVFAFLYQQLHVIEWALSIGLKKDLQVCHSLRMIGDTQAHEALKIASIYGYPMVE